MELASPSEAPAAPQTFALSPRSRRVWRRLAVAGLIVLLLHIFFFIFIAPRLELEKAEPTPTEVVQISPQELNRLKRQMMKQKQLTPLLQQELHEEFKSKEAPKNPQMMAPFNQVVPEETVAGPQHDAPQKGGGAAGRQGERARQEKPQEKTPSKKLDLGKLGLGTKVAPPPKPSQQGAVGPRGPDVPNRPVGRDAENMKRGTDNLLNAVESAYYSFFARFDEPIIRNWYFLFNTNENQIRQDLVSRQIKPGAELPVTLEMAIDRQGNFRKIAVIQSSGIPILDQIASNAVKKLGAVPNPPEGIFEGKEYFVRQMQLTVHYVDSGGVGFRPDVYW